MMSAVAVVALCVLLVVKEPVLAAGDDVKVVVDAVEPDVVVVGDVVVDVVVVDSVVVGVVVVLVGVVVVVVVVVAGDCVVVVGRLILRGTGGVPHWTVTADHADTTRHRSQFYSSYDLKAPSFRQTFFSQ